MATTSHLAPVWFKVTDLEVSHLWTAYVVAYMIGQFATAWLGRSLRARDIVLYGMAVSSVTTGSGSIHRGPSGGQGRPIHTRLGFILVASDSPCLKSCSRYKQRISCILLMLQVP